MSILPALIITIVFGLMIIFVIVESVRSMRTKPRFAPPGNRVKTRKEADSVPRG